MAALVVTIPELLSDLMRRQKVSERQLAAYMGVSPTAMNRWVDGNGTPDPQYVWKIAELAHLPVEDVMRMAGHLPPVNDQPEPEAPTWVTLIPALSKADQEYVGRLVESLAREPVLPDESPAPEDSPAP